MPDQIAITRLEPHPDNPRLMFREDVIDGIAAQLREAGSFDSAHALLVRPVNGHYQVVRGHHRLEAAKRAGFDTVPCWVREMSDDEAYMQLALGNVQGELDPIEIGRHALGATDKGKHDGFNLAAYAQQVGQDASNITRYSKGAEVLRVLEKLSQDNFLGRAKHLYAVSKTPRELWPTFAQWIITPQQDGKPDSTPSVNQAEDKRKELNKIVRELQEAEPDTGELLYSQWADLFLPPEQVAAHFLDTAHPDDSDVRTLAALARMTQEAIATNEGKDRFDYTIDGYRLWLSDGTGTYAWDKDQLNAYRLKVIAAAAEAAKPPTPDAQVGEWYALGSHRLYCGDTGAPTFWERLPSTPFAFADPPYIVGVNAEAEGFQWTHDWLTEKADVVAVTPGIASIQDFYSAQTKMPHKWAVAVWLSNGMKHGPIGYANWIYVGLFSKQDLDYQQAQDHIKISIRTSQTQDSGFEWRKPPEMMDELIDRFTEMGDVLIDPFLGSGTTLFSAQKLGRICYGGEISPQRCNEIIDRWQDESGQAAVKMGD